MPNNTTTLLVDDIAVEVQRKRIKYMHLYVKPSGDVLLTMPSRTGMAQAEKFVRSKLDWIRTHRVRFASRPTTATRQRVDGDSVYVWGQRYTLEVRVGVRRSLVLVDDRAVMTVREGDDLPQREGVLREYLRGELKVAMSRALPKWEGITDLHPSGWQSKDMTTRWGSCNTRTRRIWLNVRLAEHPPECLEYVLLHELAHLVVRGHNARFYAILDHFMPDWRAVRARLNAK